MIVTLEAVDEMLQAEDIEGLLALGAPSDEYAHEAAEIHAALMGLGEGQCDREISLLVFGVWERAFGPFAAEQLAVRRPVLDRLVQRLLARAALVNASVHKQADVEERL